MLPIIIAFKHPIAEKAGRRDDLLPVGDGRVPMIEVQPLKRRAAQAKEEGKRDLDTVAVTYLPSFRPKVKSPCRMR
jgi:hypothetical protein